MRRPNSQECSYFGRKLSNIETDIGSGGNSYIYIGSNRDDEIYFPPVLKKGEEMLKERVALFIEDVNGDFCTNIDIEDILKFAHKYCRGIYNRVAEEDKK